MIENPFGPTIPVNMVIPFYGKHLIGTHVKGKKLVEVEL